MSGGNGVLAHFAAQADACAKLGSPFTAKLCRVFPKVLDATTRTGRAVLDWRGNPNADALALRLCGALHARKLAGDSDLAAFYPPCEVSEEELRSLLPPIIQAADRDLAESLSSPPQTNEVARSAMLLPGFAAVARRFRLPLSLREIGSSAGLNLSFDRFAYDFGATTWGDPASPVRLSPEVRGAPPDLAGAIRIADRGGCDISPIALGDAAQRLRLRSFVWADQPARLQRLDNALAIARSADAALVGRIDAADFVASALAAQRHGTALVVFHSIVWQYLSSATQSAIGQALTAAGERATAAMPLAWLRMEPQDNEPGHALLTLTLWPGGETRILARCDYHGRWLEMI